MALQKNRERFKESFVTALEIPRDLAYKETIVTLTGKERAVIENYRSILRLTDTEIIINTFSGKLTITGKRLEIPWFTAEEIVVKGCICRVYPGQ